MLDSIGREHERAVMSIFICECGGVNATHCLSGTPELNEGWGVWIPVPHRGDCSVERLDDGVAEGKVERLDISLAGERGNLWWNMLVGSKHPAELARLIRRASHLERVVDEFVHKNAGHRDLWQAYADSEFERLGVQKTLEQDARLVERFLDGKITTPTNVAIKFWGENLDTKVVFEVERSWRPRHRSHGSYGYTVELK